MPSTAKPRPKALHWYALMEDEDLVPLGVCRDCDHAVEKAEDLETAHRRYATVFNEHTLSQLVHASTKALVKDAAFHTPPLTLGQPQSAKVRSAIAAHFFTSNEPRLIDDLLGMSNTAERIGVLDDHGAAIKPEFDHVGLDAVTVMVEAMLSE